MRMSIRFDQWISELYVLGIIILLLLPYAGVFAQKTAVEVELRPRTDYIEKVDTLLNIKLDGHTEYTRFEVVGNGFLYDIRPNISISTRMSLSYRFISIGLGYKPSFIPGNNDTKMQGKTSAIGFGITLQPGHWYQDVQFNYVKGYYLHNTIDYDQNWVEGKDAYITFPELKTASIKGATGYKLNKNLSLKAASSKTEMQLRSAGSFLPFLFYEYYETDNIKAGQTHFSGQRSTNFDIVLSPSYAHAFVFRHGFYTFFGLFPGIGLQYTKLRTYQDGIEYPAHSSNVLFRLLERAAIGYNSRKFFAGAELTMSQSSKKQHSTSVTTNANYAYFRIFAGYRFDAFNLLKKETEVVKSLAPPIIQDMLE